MSGTNDKQNDPYNRGGMIAFGFSMAFVFCFFFYIVAIHPGIDLKENIHTPPVNTGVVEVAVDVSKITEPWVSSEDLIKHGKKIYGQNCAMCHGAEGLGDGTAGAALNPKPRNLVEGNWKKPGLTGHFTVLTEGLAGSSMAGYSHFKPVDRWALVHFIDSITKNKSKEDPAVVAEFAKKAK